MSAKKVEIKRKPTVKEAEEWVNSGGTEVSKKMGKSLMTPQKRKKVSIKRLTLDIPEKLHRKLKMQAAREGRTMADIVREIMEEKF